MYISWKIDATMPRYKYDQTNLIIVFLSLGWEAEENFDFSWGWMVD